MNNGDSEIKTGRPTGFDSYWELRYYIHKTCDGTRVQSKSEVIIYDLLYSFNIDPNYEKELVMSGVPKYPDFTIEDEATGITYYWEHLGMLHDPEYRARWKTKLKLYEKNDIIPREKGAGKNGTLITTRDDERGGISSEEINKLIKKIFGKMLEKRQNDRSN